MSAYPPGVTFSAAALARTLAAFVLGTGAAAVVFAPVAAEHAVESASFSDHLGAVPVDVSMTHNGASTVDTGVFGRLYWKYTGGWGFGALIRVTGPPEAAGPSLAAYVSPAFLKTSTAFVDDPARVARAYGSEFRDQFAAAFWRRDLEMAFVAGALLTLLLRGRVPLVSMAGRRRALVALAALVAASGVSAGGSAWLFHRWDGNQPIGDTYPMADVPGLSFSSPQALEIAAQVRPFIEKNSRRIRQRSDAFTSAARTSLAEALSDATDLTPRSGERVIVAEADTQGSFVGQRVRASLYEVLRERLGPDAVIARTISGDVTSNGTVAEATYVQAEAQTLPGVPTVAVKGDHDTATTVEQLNEAGILDPDQEVSEVDGLHVAVADDPAFKTLFGGTVVNDPDTTESQIGVALRRVVDDHAADEDGGVVVLVHQPTSAEAYLGVESIAGLDGGSLTEPRDDGLPDLPPGIVNIGHLHDQASPKVVWNTDTDRITWTVVNQLGTAGGVEESPVFNRFSTPFSTPLKDLTVQLQYVDVATGLQTGFAQVTVSTSGAATLSNRIDVGVPLTEPR